MAVEPELASILAHHAVDRVWVHARRSPRRFQLCLTGRNSGPSISALCPAKSIRAYPCSGLRIHREGIAAAAFARDTQ
jgi:hypothetical protein